MTRANKLHKELFKTKAHNKDVHKTNVFRSYVPGLGDTFQRKEVFCRQWSFLTYDDAIFSELKSEEDYSTAKQNSGYSDRQWHCCLGHASKGPHQEAWRISVDTFGERFSVGAIGKTMQ